MWFLHELSGFFSHAGVECPSCRKSIDVERDQIGSLPRNLALENIVIRYTEERSAYKAPAVSACVTWCVSECAHVYASVYACVCACVCASVCVCVCVCVKPLRIISKYHPFFRHSLRARLN